MSADTPAINTGSLRIGPELAPGEPLWKRAPSRGADGRLLSDFMMLIPGLGRRSEVHLQTTLGELQAVFDYYREQVVFADLNLKLNVLWVSIKPLPGLNLELAAAIKQRVPEAMLVANKAEALLSERGRRG
jgi:hypothetical protein